MDSPLMISRQLFETIIERKMYTHERNISHVRSGCNLFLLVECHICKRRVPELYIYDVCDNCEEIICKGCSRRCDWCRKEFCDTCTNLKPGQLIHHITRYESDHYEEYTSSLNENGEIKNRLVDATVCFSCEPN